MPTQPIERKEEEVKPIVQYYDPAKWQRIMERLSTLFLTGQVFTLNAGFLSECCKKQSSFILQDRPQRVIKTCCHNRRVESLVVPCLEICAVSGQRYPSILTLEVEGCINAAPSRLYQMLISLRDASEDEDDNQILHYAPDSLISWLEGGGGGNNSAETS